MTQAGSGAAGRLSLVRWPGPRSIPEGEPIWGRDNEFRRLRAAITSGYHVIEVTGETAVGKSSFLNYARRRLETLDQIVLLPQDFNWAAALAQVEKPGQSSDEVAEAIYDLALDHVKVEELATQGQGGRETVVLFDQFEELLRYRRSVAVALLTLIGRSARNHNVTHVLAARAEFSHLLRPVEQPSTRVYALTLEEISAPEVIIEIIAGPAQVARVAFDPVVLEIILRWWSDARDRTENGTDVDDSDTRSVGLLHLQALLWRLRRWAQSNSGWDTDFVNLSVLRAFVRWASKDPGWNDDAGSDADLDAFVRWAVSESGGQSDLVANPELRALVTSGDATHWVAPGQLIADALVDWIRDVTGGLYALPGQTWRMGPALMVARVARYFSTSGYKVPQGLSSLAGLALHEEMGSAALEVQGTASQRLQRLRNTELVGAGPKHGATDIAQTMMAALLVGLEYLAGPAANVLRRFSVQDPVFELVHDGMGRPLEIWAEEVLSSPQSVFGVISARQGVGVHRRQGLPPLLADAPPWMDEVPDYSPATFSIPGSRPGQLDERWQSIDLVSDKDRDTATVLHAQWPGNAITGVFFRAIAFDRCRFTGTAFIGCRFDDVTFDDCDLTGVLMKGCTFRDVRISASGGRVWPRDTVLTLDGCSARGDVTLDALPNTSSIFLLRAGGGTWRVEGCELRHLVVSGREAGDIRLAIRDSRISHGSLEAPLNASIYGDASQFVNLTNDLQVPFLDLAASPGIRPERH